MVESSSWQGRISQIHGIRENRYLGIIQEARTATRRVERDVLEEKKRKIVSMINNENVSALSTMEDELGLTHDEVLTILRGLLEENTLHGKISEDESRFWRSDAKVSQAPAIPRDDKLPDFLSYDTRPGKGLSIVGCVIDIIAFIVLTYATDIPERDFGTLLFFVGLVILLSGLYCVSRRDSPD
jgi:hypothetical protein